MEGFMAAGILITIREGLEAFLVIGILLGYLRKIGKQDAGKQIWLGAALALALSLISAVLFQYFSFALDGPAREMFEAVVTLLAVGVLTWMVLWMQRQSRYIKGELEGKLDRAISENKVFALASLAFFAIMREGIETVLILFGVAKSAESGLLLGAFLGLIIAGIISYLIFNTSVRLNLRRFFIVTGTMLLFIAAGMVSQAAHALEEAGLLSGALTNVAWNSGQFISDSGLAGKMLHVFVGYTAKPMLIQVILYLAYIAFFGSRFYLAISETAPAKKIKAKTAASEAE